MPDPEAPSEFVSLQEATIQLGVHERTVRRAISRGELSASKHGRSLAITRASLDRYVHRHDRSHGHRFRHLTRVAPPVSLTSFIGRDQLIDELCTRVQREPARLITLTGPGGVGKTRLVLQVLERAAPTFPDGAVFVPLADVTDPGLVVPAIARALGLPPAEERSPRAQLQQALVQTRLLLVLDNLEQVRGAGSEIATLVAACPGVVILVTSRVRLQVTGERCVPVLPLTLPRGAESLGAMSQREAVRLFVERARAVIPDFTLTHANAMDIAAICHHLNGLPLALELAAARMRHLQTADLRSRLDRALPLLTGGPLNAPARLQTMRGAIAWSYDLLAPAEQTLFRWLAVFAGGFAFDAIASVAGRLSRPSTSSVAQPGQQELLDPDALLERLSALVDQSLVQVVTTSDHGQVAPFTRYTLFETVREYGLEQLSAHGEEVRVRDAHAAWCVELAAQANHELTGPAQSHWFHRLELELGNFRTALTWMLAQGDGAQGLALVRGLAWFWTSRGYLQEGAQWTAAFLGLPTAADSPERGWVLLDAANIANWQGDHVAAVTHGQAGLTLFQTAADQFGIGLARRLLGSVALDQGMLDEAAAHLAASEVMLLAVGTEWDAAFARYLAGRLATARGQTAIATEHFDEAARAFGAFGDREYVAAARCQQAAVLLRQGHVLPARQAYREGLALAQELAQPRWMAWGLAGAAALALQGEHRALASRLIAVATQLIAETGQHPLDDQVSELVMEQLGLPAPTLVEAVRHEALRRALAEALAVLQQEDAEITSLKDLTPREREVLALLTQGHTDKEIAVILHIAGHTAVNHVAAIRRKLGVPSRASAVAVALGDGMP